VDRITLLNVSFVDEHDDKHDNDDDYNNTPASSAADTRAASASYRELQAIYPNKNIRFYHRKVNWNEIVAHEPHIRQLIYPKTTVMDVNIATALWFAALAASDDPPHLLLSGLAPTNYWVGIDVIKSLGNKARCDKNSIETYDDSGNEIWDGMIASCPIVPKKCDSHFWIPMSCNFCKINHWIM
jgi:hypothetical protein